MKRNSSPGYDLIPTETYIELNEIIAPTLCNTFNKALKQRKGLYEKIPVIIQVLFKGGDQTAIKQYRPLSLLPVILRIFDKILFAKLDAFIEENNILSTNQYGGRKRRNPIGLVADIMYNTLEMFRGQEDEIVLLLLCDQSKFFDRIEKSS